MNVIKYIPKIIEQLKAIDPYKVILFGSHAYGKPTLKDAQDFVIFAKTVFEKIETIIEHR